MYIAKDTKLIVNFNGIELIDYSYFVAPIYWQFDEYLFPCLEWNDEPLDILNKWSELLVNLLLNTSRSEKLYFRRGLGGPLYLYIEADGQIFNISCIDDRIFQDKPIKFIVKTNRFVQQVYLCSTRFVSFCDTNIHNERIRNEHHTQKECLKYNSITEKIELLRRHCNFLLSWKRGH